MLPLSLVASALLLTLSLLGYGALMIQASRRWVRGAASEATLGDAGLLGLLCLAGIGQLLHFLVSLSPAMVVTLHGCGLLWCILFRRALLSWASALDRAFALVCLVAVLYQSLTDTPLPDAAIYYLPSIKWNAELPLIPGLGNLHGRLAFNSTQWVLAALVKLPFAPWESAFLLNALFALFVLTALFQRVHRASLRETSWLPSTLYALVVLGGFCASNLFFSGSLGSLSWNFPPAILILYCLYLLLLILETTPWLLPYAVAVACLSVTIKVSSMPVLAGVAVVLGWAWGAGVVERKPLAASLTVSLALLLPWLGRGLLLSGCLLYPEPWTCIGSLPWTIPRNLAVNEARYIFVFARGSLAEPVSLWDWIEPALRDLTASPIGTVVIVMGLAGFALLSSSRRVVQSGDGPPVMFQRRAVMAAFILGIPVAGIALSVVKGPTLRYNLGYWYGLGALLLAWGASAHAGRLPSRERSRCILPILCVLLAAQGGLSAWHYSGRPTRSAWPGIGRTRLTVRTTSSGLQVFVPEGDTCWDAPLPCTPYFHPALQMIPIGDRFYLKGANEAVSRRTFP